MVDSISVNPDDTRLCKGDGRWSLHQHGCEGLVRSVKAASILALPQQHQVRHAPQWLKSSSLSNTECYVRANLTPESTDYVRTDYVRHRLVVEALAVPLIAVPVLSITTLKLAQLSSPTTRELQRLSSACLMQQSSRR